VGNILSHDEILKLHAAVVSARLTANRTGLLAGLPAEFIATLPQTAMPAEQVLADLDAINAARSLADGSMPIAVWLRNAAVLAGLRSEAAVFEQVCEQVRGVTREQIFQPAERSKERPRDDAQATGTVEIPAANHVRSRRGLRDQSLLRNTPSLPSLGRCVGREYEIGSIVRELLHEKPPAILVLGGPGIGKSTLTLAALHDPRIIESFGNRRYFVRLDAAPTAEAAIGAIADAMSLPPGTMQRAAIYDALSIERTLVILDNAETPWDQDERETTEALFGELHSLPCLALVVSVRSTTEPKGVVWGHRIDVEPLTEGQQLDLFCDIAGNKYRSDPRLLALLEAQGGVPFAIDLLARAAEGNDISFLAEEWMLRSTDLLTREGAKKDRYSSWAASIEVSFRSNRMTREARHLAGMLSLLPDGVSHKNLDNLLPGRGSASFAARVLVHVGLAFFDAGRLRMRPPIREYLAQEHPPSKTILARTVQWYVKMAHSLGSQIGYKDGATAAEQLAAEVANLDAMIRNGLKQVDATACIDAAVALTEFARFSGRISPSPLRPALEAAQTAGDVRREARCLESLGQITTWRLSSEARDYLEQALDRFRRLGDEHGEADCIHRLGHISLEQCRYEDALEQFVVALSMYQKAQDTLGVAYCTEDLGDIARKRANYEVAKAYLESALSLYRQLGFIAGEAGCAGSLGEIALECGRMGEACEFFNAALSLYRRAGNAKGEADSVLGLGDVERKQGRSEKARECYNAALDLCCRVGFLRGQADCIQGFGDLDFQNRHLELARVNYEKALALYVKISDLFAVGGAHRRIAQCAAGSDERKRHLEAARIAWGQIGRADLIENLMAEFDDAFMT
jgi:tetratricopeptide (TPR) repeat protein